MFKFSVETHLPGLRQQQQQQQYRRSRWCALGASSRRYTLMDHGRSRDTEAPEWGRVQQWHAAWSCLQRNPASQLTTPDHPSGTLYLLTFDCARAFPYLSATWKPICSDWLSPPVLLQAPLYLRTSRRYRNVLLLLLLLLLSVVDTEASRAYRLPYLY